MKLLGWLMLAFVVVGLVSAMAKALIIVGGVVLLVALAMNPREVGGFVVTLLMIGLFSRYPVPVAILTVAALIAEWLRRPET
jgi:NAD/NADP transhydrogenase alpha subunit